MNSVVVAVNNFGDTRSGGLAGPMGLFIIVLMSIAVVLLIRNMNKRLRRLPDSFPDQGRAESDAEAARRDAPAAVVDPGETSRGSGAGRFPTAAGVAEAEVSDIPQPGEGTSATSGG